MQYYPKIDKYQIAQINKYNVFRCLGLYSPINQAVIAKRTGLSIPTVMSIVDELSKKKAVRSLGKGESSGGKPPEMLELMPDRFFTIGLDIGRTTLRLVVNNVVSQQITCLQEPTGTPVPERAFVRRLSKLILRVVSGYEPSAILGLGIAMPGLIENETGNVIFSPDFGWIDVPLKAWMQEELSFPLLVENANRALSLNESYIPHEPEHNHTTFSVNLGYGIGAGLIIGDTVYTGASGTSGEIGHITVDPQGPRCQCGNIGCLEALASGGAIAQQGRELAEQNSHSKIATLAQGDYGRIDARIVFQAAGQGDPEAAAIIEQAAEYIGIGISMAINVLDPDRLVLCGGLMKNDPSFFEAITASIDRHKMRHGGRRLVISRGSGGEYSTANGACRVLANHLWRHRALPI